MKHRLLPTLLVLSLLALNLFVPTQPVHASGGAYLTVNSNTDADNGGDGVCTLREAIWAAVGNVDYHECIHSSGTYGDDEIHFSFSGSSVITLTSALPSIALGSVTIFGDNDAGSNVVIDGANAYTPFYVPSGATLILHGLTIQNSHAASIGGAISVASGVLEVYASAFLNNSAVNDGGAISIGDGGTGVIVNSTFSGNSANYAGALSNNSGNVTLLNSTFSGNSATTHGSALSIWHGGSAAPATTVYNSILANSSGAEDCWNGLGSGTLSGSKNIIETTEAGSGSCDAITTSTADPALGLLTGSPAYFPLTNDSAAIDTGDNAQCAASPVNNQSQNGIPRPQDGDNNGSAICDVGSFEAISASVFRSNGAQDGWILESSWRSNKGGTPNPTATTLRLGDDAARKQYRSILSFNTSSLPDNAVITKVTLKVKKQGVTGGGNPVSAFLGFMVDVKKGAFGTSALQAADFQTAANKIVGPVMASPVGGWYTLNLTPAKASVNKLGTGSGLTQIRLRFNLDDNNNAVANYLSLYSGNAAVGTRPQLIVEYYVP